jgi:hypothetical protein
MAKSDNTLYLFLISAMISYIIMVSLGPNQ